VRLRLDRRLLVAAGAALVAIQLLAVMAGLLLGLRQQPLSSRASSRGTWAGGGALNVPPADPVPSPHARDDKAYASALPFATFPSFTMPTFRRWRPMPRRRTSSSTYEPLLSAAALRHGLPPELVLAVTRIESDFDPATISNKGALGLMQVMPGTGARFGVARHELLDPHRNIAAGTAYLAWLYDRYRGNLDLTLAAYNAGEGAVDKYRGIPPYRETQEYVRKVRAELAR
jgi:soluble lytic murein transglycosylase-like protein